MEVKLLLNINSTLFVSTGPHKRYQYVTKWSTYTHLLLTSLPNDHATPQNRNIMILCL